MNREKYLKDRQELQNKAQNFLNEGKVDEANAVMEEIKALDEKFEEASKAQANLNAMGEPSQTSFSNAMVNGESNSFSNAIEPVDPVGDMYNSTEYRTNFMNHVLSGAPISTKFKNANATTSTTDVGAVIPTTIVQRIIEKLEVSGEILRLVTPTNYKGGVSIPKLKAKPVAVWVDEGKTTDRQKLGTDSITFGYHKLKCPVSITLMAHLTTLEFFENKFTTWIVEAMTITAEAAIIAGTGVKQPKGIFKETVVEGQNIDLAKAKAIDYKLLVQMKAKVPSAYKSKVKWIMNENTWPEIEGMTDSTGQPIARVNYGIDGEAKPTLLGKPVVFHDAVPTYDAAPTADIVPIALYDFSDYLLNSQGQMIVKTYEDNETDEIVTKAIWFVDGKVCDNNSLVTLTKKTV